MDIQLMHDELDAQPDGTFLICRGQEVLIKCGTEWHLHTKGVITPETLIETRIIAKVISAGYVWSFS